MKICPGEDTRVQRDYRKKIENYQKLMRDEIKQSKIRVSNKEAEKKK